MRSRPLPLAAAIAVILIFTGSAAFAARQLVALFPLQNLADNTIAPEVANLGQALKEKLQDRFDVQAVSAEGVRDPYQTRRKARTVGATYILTGTVSRIGRTVTLDLTLAATEDPGKGRTVVVTGVDDRDKVPAGTGWKRTSERFIDDKSGRTITVYVKPFTGERAYVAEQFEERDPPPPAVEG